MGCTNSSNKKAKANQQIEEPPSRAKTISGIHDLVVDDKLRHSLPLPGIQSRLASAVIFSFLGKKKNVSKTVIVLNRGGRAYIITQGFLAGFLISNYESLASLMFNELTMNCKFKCENEIEEKLKLKALEEALDAQLNSEKKFMHVKHRHPELYVAYLTSEGKFDELKSLFDGDVT